MADKIERLKDSDLEIHLRMSAKLNEARQLEAEADQMRDRAKQLAAGFLIWFEDLHERYELDGNKGEGVLEDGTIVRTQVPTPLPKPARSPRSRPQAKAKPKRTRRAA